MNLRDIRKLTPNGYEPAEGTPRRLDEYAQSVSERDCRAVAKRPPRSERMGEAFDPWDDPCL